MNRFFAFFALSLVALSLVAACAVDPGDEISGAPRSLRFEAFVADEPFSCAETYRGLGRSGATAVVEDLRFYLHDIKVVDDVGQAAGAIIVDDGIWQNEHVALVDFTDGTGHCQNTSAQQNTAVDLRIPDGDWQGIRFKIGVPFEQNHVDLTHAPAPLNVPSMFWSWNAGFKFLRLDMPTEEHRGFRVHLGSTRCDPAPGGGVTGCEYPNRPQVVVEEFDLDREVLRFDLGALLATSDMDHHTESTPQGCMSTVDDPDCGPLFDALGLSDGSAVESGIFTAQARP